MKNINTLFICSLFFVASHKPFTDSKKTMNTDLKPEAKNMNVFLNHVYAIIDEKTYNEIKLKPLFGN